MKTPRGHNGQPIELTGGALEQLHAERMNKIQTHLTEMNNILTVENSAINAVTLAAIQFGGLPPAGTEQEFLGRCRTIAKDISDAQVKRKWEHVKDIMKRLNVHDINPSVIYASELAGVVLFDPVDDKPAGEAPVETPKIITH